MRNLTLVLLTVLVSCSTDKEENPNSLENTLEGKEVVLDNVISCAALNKNDDLISVFLYPREGARNIRYFEMDVDGDKNDFSLYSHVNAPLLNVFNGYLLKYEVEVDEEKWVIVSFEEEGKIHLSNPIRLKQSTKPTEYLPGNISIDKTDASMPLFSWQDGTYDDTKIYFQVISDSQNNLLSGTYTFERMFRYYELENVVLNITESDPPELKTNTSYNFTLMAVSEDNWVNQFSEIEFSID